MDIWFKYPKTLHFPWSPGLQNDDRMMPMEDVLSNFSGHDVVISEKLDGENTSLYRDHIHARSVYSGDHPSRSWVKALHGRIKNDIPEGWRICGENVFAHHSLFYNDLETYFYVFGIYNEENICLSWKETCEWCSLLDLHTVPVLWNDPFQLDIVQNQLPLTLDFTEVEGFVMRNTNSFRYLDFQKNVAKFVRKGHVQTDQHWMSKPVVKNLLKDDSI